jgi:hypothetical protein
MHGDDLSLNSAGDAKTKPPAFLKRGDGRRNENKEASRQRRPLRPTKQAWGDPTNGVEDLRQLRTKTKAPVPRFNARAAAEPAESRDFLKHNQASLWKHRKPEPADEPPRPKGEVPRYIKAIKAKREKAARAAAVEAAARAEEDVRGGEGHTLPEPERRAIVASLKARRAAAEFEFQRFSHTAVHGPRRTAYVEGLGAEMDDLDAMLAKMEAPVVFILH